MTAYRQSADLSRWPFPSGKVKFLDADQLGHTETPLQLKMRTLFMLPQRINQKLGVCDDKYLILFRKTGNQPAQSR